MYSVETSTPEKNVKKKQNTEEIEYTIDFNSIVRALLRKYMLEDLNGVTGDYLYNFRDSDALF